MSSIRHTFWFFLLPLFAFGCATVHQSPAIDPEKMKTFAPQADASAKAGDPVIAPVTSLSLSESIRKVLATCYDLEIPLFVPLVSADSLSARVTSGTFVAKCSEDCKCGRGMAIGHGSKSASGVLQIRLRDVGHGTAVTVQSMYWRTQSSDGDFGSTENLYFETLGRIEKRILEDLGAR
ncbi:MAG: hypothetical protein U0527_01435 [Candidatus Eisenbacteria bacterium]